MLGMEETLHLKRKVDDQKFENSLGSNVAQICIIVLQTALLCFHVMFVHLQAVEVNYVSRAFCFRVCPKEISNLSSGCCSFATLFLEPSGCLRRFAAIK